MSKSEQPIVADIKPELGFILLIAAIHLLAIFAIYLSGIFLTIKIIVISALLIHFGYFIHQYGMQKNPRFVSKIVHLDSNWTIHFLDGDEHEVNVANYTVLLGMLFIRFGSEGKSFYVILSEKLSGAEKLRLLRKALKDT